MKFAGTLRTRGSGIEREAERCLCKGWEDRRRRTGGAHQVNEQWKLVGHCVLVKQEVTKTNMSPRQMLCSKSHTSTYFYRPTQNSPKVWNDERLHTFSKHHIAIMLDVGVLRGLQCPLKVGGGSCNGTLIYNANWFSLIFQNWYKTKWKLRHKLLNFQNWRMWRYTCFCMKYHHVCLMAAHRRNFCDSRPPSVCNTLFKRSWGRKKGG